MNRLLGVCNFRLEAWYPQAETEIPGFSMRLYSDSNDDYYTKWKRKWRLIPHSRAEQVSEDGKFKIVFKTIFKKNQL